MSPRLARVLMAVGVAIAVAVGILLGSRGKAPSERRDMAPTTTTLPSDVS